MWMLRTVMDGKLNQNQIFNAKLNWLLVSYCTGLPFTVRPRATTWPWSSSWSNRVHASSPPPTRTMKRQRRNVKKTKKASMDRLSICIVSSEHPRWSLLPQLLFSFPRCSRKFGSHQQWNSLRSLRLWIEKQWWIELQERQCHSSTAQRGWEREGMVVVQVGRQGRLHCTQLDWGKSTWSFRRRLVY